MQCLLINQNKQKSQPSFLSKPLEKLSYFTKYISKYLCIKWLLIDIFLNIHGTHYNTNATITVIVTNKDVFSLNKTLQRNSLPSAPSNHQTMCFCNCVLCKHCKTNHISAALANPPKASLRFLSISLMSLYTDLSFVIRFIDNLRGHALFSSVLFSQQKFFFSWSYDNSFGLPQKSFNHCLSNLLYNCRHLVPRVGCKWNWSHVQGSLFHFIYFFTWM